MLRPAMRGALVHERSRASGAASAGALDVLLYGGSAVAALIVLTTASVPQYREWARFALVAYALGTVGSVGLLAVGRGSRARVSLTALVFLAAGVAPLAFEVVARSHTAPGFHAQSEVLITEEAAKALVDGRDPYEAVYLHGSLAARPLGTKTHLPYLPGIIVFGLPRALDGRSPWADARLPFLAVTLAAAVAAVRFLPSGRARLRAAQVLLILPTGALALATGGDDLPVLALLLLAFALASRDRPVGAGIAAGVAAALKQTAWLALPFLIVSASPGRGRTRLAGASATVAGLAILPFVAWNPPAFVEDVIRFPLGIGRQRSAAGTPSVGSALRDAMSGHGVVAVAVVVILLAVLAVWLLRRPGSAEAAGAARNAAVLFAVAMVLAPSVRIGYAVYPVNLLAWSLLLGSRPATVEGMSNGAVG